jgi:hypothetical protein
MSHGIGEQPSAEDDLDRALRELTEKTVSEAAFKEPSAKERAKAARKQSRRAGKKASRQAAEPSAGWRGGYRYDLSARELRRQHRRGRRLRALKVTSWTVAIAVLAGAGVFAYQHVAHAPGGPDDVSVVTNGAKPVAKSPLSSLAGSQDGPPADPFAGTAADHWADGAAGIVVPTAKAVGSFTASQVAEAYSQTRELLIAQNLDHATLLGGAPTAFANLLTPAQRSDFISGLDKIGRDKEGGQLSTRVWVTSFAPGSTALIGSVIKVHGTMSARATTGDDPELVITVNYRFVYPIKPPHAPQDWMRIVGSDVGPVEFSNWQGGGGSFEPWVRAVPDQAGARCDSADGFAHPEFPNGPPDKDQPTGKPFDPYSMQQRPDNKGCQLTTGT